MSLVAGIDLSSYAVDCVLIDADDGGAAPEWHRWTMSGPSSFDRARGVRDAMPARGWWNDIGVLAVGIEDPRGMAAGHAYRIQGGILACLPQTVLVTPWIPSQWRKAVGLAGNCSKADVTAWARKEQAKEGTTNTASNLAIRTWVDHQDACDAYCIALATRQAISIGQAA